jgi:hypothetical protein
MGSNMSLVNVRGFRSMLNLPGHESVGAVVAELVERSYGTDVSFVLSDCARSVSLSFDIESDEGYENALHKLDTIAKAATTLRREIVKDKRKRDRA